MRYLITITAAIFIFSFAAKAQSTTAPTAITGYTWNLAYIPGHVPEKLDKGVTLTVSDTTDRIGGYAGCNGYGGHYTLKGKKVKFEKIIATMKGCVEGSKTESKMFELLEKTNKYDLKNGQLRLKKGGKVLAVFNVAN